MQVDRGNNRILDLGCGAGIFGEYLKAEGYAAQVVGIEMNPSAAEEAKARLDDVICLDLNRNEIGTLLRQVGVDQFDYIVCADVLEHLIDPWQTLSDLMLFLAPRGRVVASLPNARHWSVWLPLIVRGEWTYRDAGIMDRTHLRFFTRSTAVGLLANAGLRVIRCRPLIGGKSRIIDKMSLSLLREFIAIQWIVVGVKG